MKSCKTIKLCKIFLLKVLSAALSGCVADLQQNMDVPFELSPAWIMAAAQHFSPRLDTLSHAFQVQSQVADRILKQLSQNDSTVMVRI